MRANCMHSGGVFEATTGAFTGAELYHQWFENRGSTHFKRRVCPRLCDVNQ